MAKFFRQNIGDQAAPGSPVAGSMTGLQVMKRFPTEAIMRAQDKIVGTSRRVVASSGLHGHNDWRVPNTDPVTFATPQAYPTNSFQDTIYFGKIDVTPGHVLQFSVIYSPSGMTQRNIGASDWRESGSRGELEITTIWNDQDAASETTTHLVRLTSSLREFAQEPDEAFSALRYAQIIVKPSGNYQSAAIVQRWSRQVTAEITIDMIASCRVIDWCLYEVPIAICFEADDAADLWVSHLFGRGHPDNVGPGPDFPYQRLSETTPDGNRRGGTHHLQDVSVAQRLRLGPMLVAWANYEESAGGPTDFFTGLTFSGTTIFRQMFTFGTGGYDVDQPGWSVSAGGYARDFLNNETGVLRDRIASVPVLVRVHADMDASTGAFRFQTSQHSFVDIVIDTTGPAWFSARGYLEVGIAPEQPTIGQGFALETGGNTLTINAFTIEIIGAAAIADF